MEENEQMSKVCRSFPCRTVEVDCTDRVIDLTRGHASGCPLFAVADVPSLPFTITEARTRKFPPTRYSESIESANYMESKVDYSELPVGYSESQVAKIAETCKAREEVDFHLQSVKFILQQNPTGTKSRFRQDEQFQAHLVRLQDALFDLARISQVEFNRIRAEPESWEVIKKYMHVDYLPAFDDKMNKTLFENRSPF